MPDERRSTGFIGYIRVSDSTQAGAATIAAVLTSFALEGIGKRRVDAVIHRLQRAADLVMAYFNEPCGFPFRSSLPKRMMYKILHIFCAKGSHHGYCRKRRHSPFARPSEFF